jgi:alkylation response protein AidB-like acyl-CoA dehydrogenase
MNLSFSEEQRLLKDSVERFVAQAYGPSTRQQILESAPRFSLETWQDFAKFGWLGLPVPEADGGIGAGPIEIGILMEAFGRGLVLEPYVSTVVLGVGLITKAGSPEQRDRLLPAIVSGELRIALAHTEQERSFDPTKPDTRARSTGDGWQLSGRKVLVFDAPSANRYIVSASLEDSSESAVGLFLVPQEIDGLKLEPFETIDGRLAARLELNDVRLDKAMRLDALDDARQEISAAIDHAIAASCAGAVGCMDALLAQTVDYVKTRVQFGQSLSANQVLRHKLVDMAVQCEEARAMALRASLHLSSPASMRARAVSGAKHKISRAARFVGETAIQLHGAMGVTEELSVGAYVKRLMAFEMMFGTAAEHQRRLIALREQPDPAIA